MAPCLATQQAKDLSSKSTTSGTPTVAARRRVTDNRAPGERFGVARGSAGTNECLRPSSSAPAHLSLDPERR